MGSDFIVSQTSHGASAARVGNGHGDGKAGCSVSKISSARNGMAQRDARSRALVPSGGWRSLREQGRAEPGAQARPKVAKVKAMANRLAFWSTESLLSNANPGTVGR
jgi:hypothetical protein